MYASLFFFEEVEAGESFMSNALKIPKTIYITETDRERLEGIISSAPSSPNIEGLQDELDRANIVRSEEVPPDVVTMNSKVSFKDVATGKESKMVLVYPKDADVEHGKISILAPVGSALIGLKVGDEIEWPVPSGKTRILQIMGVLFQPEAAGQFDL